jgi:CheY-like chemotaxis protein
MAAILVVDDNPAGRILLARLLKLEGHRPLVAEDVWQAMEILERRPVDLVVLDFNLPGLDGDALLAQLARQRRFKDLPVIMVTAQRFNEQLYQQHRDNLRDWMTKGDYNADELMASIEQNLNAPDCQASMAAVQ